MSIRPYEGSHNSYGDGGQEDAYKEVIKTAVGGAAGVIHAVDCATTDCQPNENVVALRMLTMVFLCRDSAQASSELVPLHSLLHRFMLGKKVE